MLKHFFITLTFIIMNQCYFVKVIQFTKPVIQFQAILKYSADNDSFRSFRRQCKRRKTSKIFYQLATSMNYITVLALTSFRKMALPSHHHYLISLKMRENFVFWQQTFQCILIRTKIYQTRIYGRFWTKIRRQKKEECHVTCPISLRK